MCEHSHEKEESSNVKDYIFVLLGIVVFLIAIFINQTNISVILYIASYLLDTTL